MSKINPVLLWLSSKDLVLPLDCYSDLIPNHPSLVPVVAPTEQSALSRTIGYNFDGFKYAHRQISTWCVFDITFDESHSIPRHYQVEVVGYLHQIDKMGENLSLEVYKRVEETQARLLCVQGIDYYHPVKKGNLRLLGPQRLNRLPQYFGRAEQEFVGGHRKFNMAISRVHGAACLTRTLPLEEQIPSFCSHMRLIGGVLSACLMLGLPLYQLSQGREAAEVSQEFVPTLAMSFMNLNLGQTLFLEGARYLFQSVI